MSKHLEAAVYLHDEGRLPASLEGGSDTDLLLA